MILHGARLLGQGDAPGWLAAESGLIARLGAGEPPDGERVDLTGCTLVPGFVDLHVHGGDGGAFQSGDPAEAAKVVAYHRRHGTTTMLGSLVTAPVDELADVVRRLGEVVEEGLLAGVHLEGPFLSEARCGAHDPALLRDPLPELLDPVLSAGAVRMVTIAPERDGGLEAVRRTAGHGAIAAVGHTDATYDVTRQAVDAGATVATHLFNGMRPLHHREPGPILALAEDDRVVLELICDGIHLHPAIVRDVVAERPGRTAFVTDAIAAAGLGDGSYRLGELEVAVRDGVPTVVRNGSLAGSTLTTAGAVRTAVRAGVPLETAIEAASTTPARVLGLADRGRIEIGLRADLVALDDDLQVRAVFVGGDRVA